MVDMLVLAHSYWIGLACLLGLIVGSFLNVVIDRLPYDNLSIVRPRSYCFSCNTPISWHDNIPVLSWLLLKRKCRHCGIRISWQYPCIELASCIFAGAIVYLYGISTQSAGIFVLFSILVPIAVIDWQLWIIPPALSLFLGCAGLALNTFNGKPLSFSLLGALIGGSFFACILVCFTWALRIRGRLSSTQTALGWGDVWLLAGIGAWVGVFGLIAVVFLASLQGILFFALQMFWPALHKQVQQIEADDLPSQALPFGSFLALATLQTSFLLLHLGLNLP